MLEPAARRANGLGTREAGETVAAKAPPLARSPAAWALSLQRTAGNAAVAHMVSTGAVRTLARGNDGGTATVTAPATTTFKSSGIQEAVRKAPASPTPRQLEALKVLDTVRADGAWATIKWNPVANGAARRVLNPDLIDQHVLDVCGPAAALHASAGRDPMDYVKLVVEVYENGTAKGKKVNANLLGGTRPPRGDRDEQMSQVDWMVLSAMQDVTNTFMKYEGYVGDKASGFLPFGMMTLLEDFAGCVKTTHYSCLLWGVEEETAKVTRLLRDHGDDVVVVIAVNDELLHEQNADPWPKPNHFVRLLEPVEWKSDRVTTAIFTWGSRMPIDMPPAKFRRMVGGYTVGARKADIGL